MKKAQGLLVKGWVGLAVALALAGCGGGSSNDTPASVRYSLEPALPSGSTEITGVRGVTGSPDVYLTGINQDGSNYALLYQGPIQMTSASQWNRIGPAKCVVTTTSLCEQDRKSVV